MTIQIRPMLAATFEKDRTIKHLEQDGYLLVQPKIDGMRVLLENGLPRSRSWKVWSNLGLQALSKHDPDLMHGWDGEILPGIIKSTPTAEAFRTAMSDVRASGGDTNFTYYLFDNFDPSWANYTYEYRFLACYTDLLGAANPYAADGEEEGARRIYPRDAIEHSQVGYSRMFEGEGFKCLVKLCPTYIVRTLEEIYALEQQFLDDGFEGAMIKRKGRGYKYNRATALEGGSTKLKRFTDFEATILSVYARQHNANEAKTSELGYTARSSHKANKVDLECLGGFHCALLEHPEVEFDVGVFKGLSFEDKEHLWTIRDQLPGKVITCVEQDYKGGYDKPRTPIFHRFRDPTEL